MRAGSWKVCGLVALAVACAGGSKAKRAGDRSPEQIQAELQNMFERELPALKAFALTSTDGTLTGTVEAAKEPAWVDENGADVLVVPLGTASPLFCSVYRERIDASGSLGLVIRHTAQKVQLRSARAVDVGVAGGSPLLFVELEYVKKAGQGTLIGHVKAAAYVHPSSSLLCLHDELGYRETFKRVVSSLAQSLKNVDAGESPSAPRLREVHSLKVDSQPVGFVERLVTSQGETWVAETYTSTLLPRSESELLATDTAVAETVNKDGEVTGVRYAKTIAGALQTELELRRLKGLTYHYAGTHDRKKFEGTFDAPKALTMDLAQSGHVRSKLLIGTAPELRFMAYLPGANTSGPVEIVYRKNPAKPRDVTIEVAGLKMIGRVDDHGRLEWMEVPAGRRKVTQERRFVHESAPSAL